MAPNNDEEPIIQILSKADFTQQSLIPIPPSSIPNSPLGPSSVRVRTVLIALTANNLGYAALGTQLHWWSTYPIPSSAPAPFNDEAKYGIVPAWGYAQVLESTTAIARGSLLWGCWPVSTYPTELRLAPAAAPEGHWMETSEHRKELMALYQRYISLPFSPTLIEPLADEMMMEKLAQTALLKPLWEAAYLLNRFAFVPRPSSPASGGFRIHPCGQQGEWTVEDGDLSSSIVVILAASSKTAMAFANELCDARIPNTGPLGILQVSTNLQSPEPTSSIPIRTATYTSTLEAEPSATTAWLSSLNPSRIVIVDFGGRDDAAGALNSLLNESESLRTVKTTIIGVGAVHRPGASAQWSGGKVPSNASSAREAVIERVGADRYFEGLEEAFEEILRKGGLGLEVELGRGMVGDEGVEGGWRRLCEGCVEGRKGLAYLL
ncbi:MAG: hypothetical protein Q9219_004846 [cf. Caloplaca sp. 3 TL-2023]